MGRTSKLRARKTARRAHRAERARGRRNLYFGEQTKGRDELYFLSNPIQLELNRPGGSTRVIAILKTQSL